MQELVFNVNTGIQFVNTGIQFENMDIYFVNTGNQFVSTGHLVDQLSVSPIKHMAALLITLYIFIPTSRHCLFLDNWSVPVRDWEHPEY